MNDPYNLQRFVDAQEPVYQQVLDELHAGRKRSHWMWYIFPQLKGLGRSGTAEWYGIASLGEARAYLAHPVLVARLRECVRIATEIEGRTAVQVFGETDAMKLRSSLTLFAAAAEDRDDFTSALERYFGGQPDSLTLERLRASQSG